MSKKNRARTKRSQPVPVKSGFSITRNWVIGLILGFTFLAFANTLSHDFAYDDQTQILENQLIRSFSNIPIALTSEVWFWRVLQDKDPNKEMGPTTPYYRPMFVIYLMIGWNLFGISAPGWHLFNILMHLAAVYFAFLILEKITGDLRLSAISTLLFAVHPLRAESVAWISGVTDLFLALFLLPSSYFYMLYREAGKAKHLVASLGLFLLAAFSKEPAVALPIFIVAYEVFIFHQGRSLIQRIKPACLYSAGFFLVSAVYFVMRYKALGFIFNDNKYTSYPLHHVLMTIPLVIWKYIGLLLWPFWPVNLSLFHQTLLVQNPLSLRFLLPFVGIMAAVVALWPLRKSLTARFAILWFIIQLLPVLNLSAFAVEFMVQERYVYIPSIGFSLLLSIGLAKLPIENWLPFRNHWTAEVATVGLIALLLGGTTLAQNQVWKDDLTLWKHGVEAAPDQTMPYFVLGHKYLNQKPPQPEEVAETLEEYVKLDPDNPVVLSNLAAAHLFLFDLKKDRAHVDRAIWLAERGLKISEMNDALWDTLGRAYVLDTDLKNYERAHYFFDRGLALRPDNAMINFHKGATYAKQDKQEEALLYLELARRQQPNGIPDIYKFMAYSYMDKGQIREAIDNFSRYLELQPAAADAPRVSQELEKLRAQLQGGPPRS